MDESTLCCNALQCRKEIVDSAWVTRCLHVFCPDHGRMYFVNTTPQIPCPTCNEINARETDITQCDVNPHDLVLSGLPPYKAISMAAKSLKLWWYQAQQEKHMNSIKIKHLNQRLCEAKQEYENMIKKLQMKFQTEIDGLKKYHKEIVEKSRQLYEELDETKNNLRKYQVAYNSLLIEQKSKNKNWASGAISLNGFNHLHQKYHRNILKCQILEIVLQIYREGPENQKVSSQ